MQIWVDADACPKLIKEILFRAAERMQISMILVANTPLWTPPSRFIRAIRVPRGFNVADLEIAGNVEAGDLVVTADIPLAAEAIGRGGHALDPRGVLYTNDNIQERLAMRNLMDQLRASGVETGGPAPWSRSDSHAFAYSDSASGVYLATVLLPRLGIADQIAGKSMRVEGQRVAAVVARGEAEIGFQQISELLSVPGVDFVGPLPSELQRITVFSAGIAVGAKEHEAARALVTFLASPAAEPAITKSGMEPMTAR